MSVYLVYAQLPGNVNAVIEVFDNLIHAESYVKEHKHNYLGMSIVKHEVR